MDLNDEPGEMTPTELADFAMAATGPSMYATKSQHTPPGDHSEYYTTRWDLTVPIENLKDSVVKVNFVETACPNPSIPPGNMLIYTNIIVINSDVPNGNRLIASEQKLISGHYAQKAGIYKVLYEFVGEIRNLCKAGLPFHMLIYQLSSLVNTYASRNKEGKFFTEAAEMSPAELTRQTMAAIGPSVYAQKIETYPETNFQHRSVTWRVEIPLSNPQLLPGQKINLFIREFSHSSQELVLFITVKALAPQSGLVAYESTTILNDARLLTVPWTDRAEAYKVLYKYVNDVREICQGPKYMVIMQQIADLTNSIQGYPPGREPKPEQESVKDSSLELAAVLLEMNPAELAKTSVAKVTQLSQPFYVLLEEGKFHCEPDGTVKEYYPAREFTDLTAQEMESERQLLQIVKFNVVEWIGHYHTNVANDVDFHDIGYWFKDGEYTPPDTDWREMVSRHAGDRADRGYHVGHPEPVGEAKRVKARKPKRKVGEFTEYTALVPWHYEPDNMDGMAEVMVMMDPQFNLVGLYTYAEDAREMPQHYVGRPTKNPLFVHLKRSFYVDNQGEIDEQVSEEEAREQLPMPEAMTAKDLAIQSVGLQIMAPTTHHTSSEGRDVRTYAWKNTAHGYTFQSVFTEHRAADRLLLSFTPWVETRPTIYGGGSGFTIYDGSMSGKGDIYTRIWKALHDIKAAHDAGIDKEELLDLAIQVFHKESMLSDQDQEKKGRPVI